MRSCASTGNSVVGSGVRRIFSQETTQLKEWKGQVSMSYFYLLVPRYLTLTSNDFKGLSSR